MPFITYEKYQPRGKRQKSWLTYSYDICEAMQQQGFSLTVRQLHYQFVSRDLYENIQTNYKDLGDLVSAGRRGGHLDWDWIVDRTRFSTAQMHYDSPADILKAAADSYRVDKWAGQKFRPEVWIEKDALLGVIEGVCTRNDVRYTACRGYSSDSEMWRSAYGRLKDIRLGQNGTEPQRPVILHLGDHDPSGRDMTRDIEERLTLFWGVVNGKTQERIKVPVLRLALNMEQILQYDPPENFAKLTDSRAGVIRKDKKIVGIKPGSYIDEFSKLDDTHEPIDRAENTPSWELDALDPQVIVDLIQDALDQLRDTDLWDKQVAKQEQGQQQLRDVADGWNNS